MYKILLRKFYSRPTLDVAKDLLGCVLVRKITPVKSGKAGARSGEQFDGVKEIRAIITETEAYVGEDDLASHASKGRTPRTELMYGEAGHAYVYLVYGMYNCLNIVTEKKDFPAAVLIRAVKIEAVEYKKTNGPGKLCKVLEIDKNLNGLDVTLGEKMWIESSRSRATGQAQQKEIVANKRIGIDYARHCKEYLWRFTLKEYTGRK